MLILFVGLITPNACSCFKLVAWLMADRIQCAVFDLTGIGGAAEVDIEVAVGVDDERMHRVVAGQRQAGDNNLRGFRRHDRVALQRIADDLVILFRVKPAIIKVDAGAPGGALRHAWPKTLDHVGSAVAGVVLERNKKAAGRRLVILIIAAAPGVEVEHAVRAEYHLASMAEIVGKNRGAKAGRQRDPAVIAGAGAFVRTGLPTLRS